jgi:hypothetical protein
LQLLLLLLLLQTYVIGDTLEGSTEDAVEISAEMGLFRSKLSEVCMPLLLLYYSITVQPCCPPIATASSFTEYR